MCYGTNVLFITKGNKLPLFITHSSSKTNSEIPYKPVTALHANMGFQNPLTAELWAGVV
jgi:hypothetical protein